MPKCGISLFFLQSHVFVLGQIPRHNFGFLNVAYSVERFSAWALRHKLFGFYLIDLLYLSIKATV